MSTQSRLLTALIEARDTISGERLAQMLGVSRAACWKQIGQLRANGLTISSNRKGYRLEAWTEALQIDKLQRFLSFNAPDFSVNPIVMETVDSTNLEVKRLAAKDAPEFTVVTAKEQTAGKGRMGRIWLSSDNGGLYTSILLRPSMIPQSVLPLSLLTALAVRDCLREFLPEKVGLKWPNDVLYNKQKVCGILCESLLEDAHVRQLTVGIGINVNQADFPDELQDKAVSIRQIVQHRIDPNYICSRLLYHFSAYYQRFITANYKFDTFLNDYRASCLTIGQAVSVNYPGAEQRAEAVNINRDGMLLLKTIEGNVVEVGAGEVQVRGLLGYA